jgi:hypothetical protein
MAGSCELDNGNLSSIKHRIFLLLEEIVGIQRTLFHAFRGCLSISLCVCLCVCVFVCVCVRNIPPLPFSSQLTRQVHQNSISIHNS